MFFASDIVNICPGFPLTRYFSFQRFLCFELICLLFSQITLRFRGLPWFDRPLCLQTLTLVGFYSSLSIMIAKFNLMSEGSHAPDSRRNLLSSFPMSPSNRQHLGSSCYPFSIRVSIHAAAKVVQTCFQSQ